jgi:REP element-mobilizing transposase RayT
MRSNYKIIEKNGIYFVSSTIIEWIPVFTSKKYFKIMIDSLNYGKSEKGLKIYFYVIMDNHFHIIVKHPDLSDLMRSLKGFTAVKILEELHKDKNKWKLDLFKYYRKKFKSTTYQVWQEGFHPQLISSDKMLAQKVEYLHYNPVKRGLVNNPEDWKYSSANNREWDDSLIIELDEIEV